ncbi:MAG: hypothetical protein M3P49_12630 [Actinomycetota bacterium]|nr:hypothetical protein [Actinomycetota bacterium]
MRVALPEDRMPEAEVALRLAFHLLDRPGGDGVAEVALDGMQVRSRTVEVFPIEGFLESEGWVQTRQEGKNDWQGTYERSGFRLEVHARSGVDDVVWRAGARRIRAECKGGPIAVRKGSPEYPSLREALGQLLTVKRIEEGDVMVAAVPDTDRFRRLAREWASAPLVERSGIRIVLVGRDGSVECPGRPALARESFRS